MDSSSWPIRCIAPSAPSRNRERDLRRDF
jgi:hypothetical protein